MPLTHVSPSGRAFSILDSTYAFKKFLKTQNPTKLTIELSELLLSLNQVQFPEKGGQMILMNIAEKADIINSLIEVLVAGMLV